MNMQYFFIKGEIKMKKNNHQKLLDITFIALFAALCYIALTVLFIPFANMYIHFGNLIVVLAALLVGGWQGLSVWAFTIYSTATPIPRPKPSF